MAAAAEPAAAMNSESAGGVARMGGAESYSPDVLAVGALLRGDDAAAGGKPDAGAQGQDDTGEDGQGEQEAEVPPPTS